jgi:hypothetical protein
MMPRKAKSPVPAYPPLSLSAPTDPALCCGPASNAETSSPQVFAIKGITIFLLHRSPWLLWWILADVFILCWFRALSARNQLEVPDTLAFEEEEREEQQAYIASWQLLRRARSIAFSLLGIEP